MNKSSLKNNLYLHKRTRLIFDGIVKSPSNATLITGGLGSGKFYVASQLANQITGNQGSKLPTTRYLITPSDNQTITIDQIRELSMAIHHNYTEPHTIIIKNAHFMTQEAQNAFLKILEEPPANIHFILTCASKPDIFATISSRCQELPIIDISTTELTDTLIAAYPNIDSSLIKQTIMRHDSKIGLIIKSLNSSTTSSSEYDYTKIAKQLLTSSAGERMISLQQYFNMTKSETLSILEALIVICKFMLEKSVQSESNKQIIKHWSTRITLANNTYRAVQKGGNTKIQLLNLMGEL